jgi:hypothetical protein
MSWFLPRRIYDELVAKASKPKAEQPISQSITVHVYQQPNIPKLDEKQIADAVRKALVRWMRSANFLR